MRVLYHSIVLLLIVIIVLAVGYLMTRSLTDIENKSETTADNERINKTVPTDTVNQSHGKIEVGEETDNPESVTEKERSTKVTAPFVVDPLGSADLTEVRARVELPLIVALEARSLRYGDPVFIRIFKQTSELELWVKNNDRFELFRTYPICRYSGKLGPKLEEGDHQAPEGFYRVTRERMNPNSRYHLSFNLGYPNRYDRAHNRTGSFLMVHGNCVSVGCYAVTNRWVEEIYLMVDAALTQGQSFVSVHAFPFHMTDENVAKYKNVAWSGFWQNLKIGYDAFELTQVPPNIEVRDKRYVVEN